MGSIIGLIAGRSMFGRTITDGAARLIAYAGLVLLLLGTFAGLVAAYNHHIIGQHEAKQIAVTAQADRKADTTAAEQRRADDTRLTQERSELQGSTDHAQTDLDRRLAFQRCLAKQQAARAKKTAVPPC